MKKIFILFLFASNFAVAQAIQSGESQINLGVGMSGWGLPVYGGYEYGFSDQISGGVEASFRNFTKNYGSADYKYTAFGIGVFANYHFNEALNIPEPWDFYGGLNLGYFNVKVDSDYPGAIASGTSFGGQLGGRYYFSDKMGVNLEFNGGSAVTGGKLGITIKL